MTLFTQPDLRAAPTSAFIEEIRRRIPVEAEIDRVLSRKMAHRAGPGYQSIPLPALIDGTRALIASEIGTDFELSNARWLHGGASKLQMAFDISWSENADRPRRTDTMVLRMEPPESIVETSRRREFEILKLMRGVVPVPPCYWIDADGRHLPHPGLIYGFADGVTKPKARPSGQVTGVGTNFGPDLRPVLADQFVSGLAAIHTIDAERLATLTAFEAAETGSNKALLRQINWWRRVWDEDRPEDLPLVNVAAQWLISNAPPLDHVSVVHGDFRAGNFLFSEEERRITAWLDWELAVLGDRHQDLAWTTGTHLGHYAEDGRTFLASGLLPPDELFRLYEQKSGLSVDPARLRYFRVFNDFMSTVHMLATAARVAKLGKTHQDVVVAWLAMIGNVIVGKLRDTLEEII
jgi:aminoglycoside phosphotransferase (APT) family kinase protein